MSRGSALTRGEKEKILRAIESDREFRYALMGLLGFTELLERFAKLEERQLKLEERMAELEERQQLLEERMARLEERFAELAERQQKLEERQQKLEERMVRLEERMAELAERQQMLEERQLKLEERMAELEERMIKLEERMIKLEEEMIELRKTVEENRRMTEYNRRDIGALTEATYTRWVWEDLRDELGERGERIVSRKRNAKIDGLDIDLLVETENNVYVVEVKIQPNHHDIDDLIRKAGLVEKSTGKQAIPVLAGTWIGGETEKYAQERGVHIIKY